MPRPCSVYGCRSNHDVNGPYYPTYSVPRNELVKPLWLRHISPCIPNPVVCSKHFSESSFGRSDTMLVNGEVMLFHTGKRKLMPDAVPTIFPDGSGYIRNRQSAIEQLPYCDDYSSDRLWQGGGASVVIPGQGAPGVNNGSIDLPPNAAAAATTGLITNPQLRAPMGGGLGPGFIPISEQMRARSSQYLSMYGYQPKMMTMNNPAATTPPMCPPAVLSPDVKFKRLAFYDLLGELLKPSTLTVNTPNGNAREPTCSLSFFLTPRQASDISMNREVGPGTRNEYVVQVQLRFCVLDTTSEQEDTIPNGIQVKVNGKVVSIPNPQPSAKQGAEPKRNTRPVNISHLIKLCPSVANNLLISWAPEYQRHYVVAVNLVRKLSAQELLERLKAKRPRHPDYTCGLIKDKLSDSDNDLATTVLRISLTCPLGKMRMRTPCRAVECSHLQCFDAGIFLSMNEKRPTWTCPVCNKPAFYDSLVVDGYFQEVLDSPQMSDGRTEVILNKDGSWSLDDKATDAASSCTLTPTKGEAPVSVDSPKADQVEEIKDDDDDDPSPHLENGDSRTSTHSEKAEVKEKDNELVFVDLTASDDEEETPPPPPPNPNPAKEVVSIPPIIPPITSKLDHAYSDSSSNLSATRSPPSVINLDSPSPSPPLANYNMPAAGVVSPPSNYMCHMRLAPDSRYHPY